MVRSLDRDEALAELALRYFTGHGPATERDLAYWATLTVTDVRRGVDLVRDRLAPFEHDGRTFWHAADDPPTAREPLADGHLLQILDEIYRGYQDSRMVLDSAGVVPRGRQPATPGSSAPSTRSGCVDRDLRDPLVGEGELVCRQPSTLASSARMVASVGASRAVSVHATGCMLAPSS